MKLLLWEHEKFLILIEQEDVTAQTRNGFGFCNWEYRYK